MIFRAIDTETTGVNSEKERHAMVEIGWTDFDDETGKVQGGGSMLINPGRPIPPTATAVHHIRDCHVSGAPSPDAGCAAVMATPYDFNVSHNVDFEKEFFGGGERPWLCTYKTGIRLWPDAPGHKLQELRYWLGMDDEPGFIDDLAEPPHRARPDSYVCAHLARRVLQEAKAKSIEFKRLLSWSNGAALLVTCYLKKHYGKKWSEVARDDPGYLHWIIDTSELDRHHKATARYYLKNPPPARQPENSQ